MDYSLEASIDQLSTVEDCCIFFNITAICKSGINGDYEIIYRRDLMRTEVNFHI